MRTARIAVTLALAILIAGPALGAAKKKPEKKPPPCPAAQRVEKMLAGLTLTDEQKSELDKVKNEFGPKLVEALKKTDVLTPEQKKARDEAFKAAKAAGKTGKELKEAAEAAVKLSDEQKARLKEARAAVTDLQKELDKRVMSLLTADQKEQLKKKAQEARKKPAK